MNRCKNCGQLLGDDEKFCPSCGTKVEVETEIVYEPKSNWEEKPNYPTKVCKKCGAEIHIDAVICPKCGCAVENEATYNNATQMPTQSQSESTVIGTLAVIFGALGGILGIILGVIGLFTYKEEKNRKKCKIGIGLCIGWIVLYIIIGLLE